MGLCASCFRHQNSCEALQPIAMSTTQQLVDYAHVTECPLCGERRGKRKQTNLRQYAFGSAIILGPQSGISLIECALCGLWYKDAVPTKESLCSVFDRYAKDVWTTKQFPYTLERRLLAPQLRGAGALLDIGSSDGGFLRAIRDIAATTSALDVYTDERCTPAVNGEYIQSFIEADAIRSRFSYDVITCFDVFEHLYNPRQALQNCRNLLADGGIIFGETGDTDAIETPEAWWYVRLVEHHIFWNTKSLSYAASEFDLSLASVKRSAHKGRRYMPLPKRLAALALHLMSPLPPVRRAAKLVLSIDTTMIGNPFVQDHVVFTLRK